MSLAEVAAVTGGSVTAEGDAGIVVTAPVVIDSRDAREGTLFAALPGRHRDGHEFVADALCRGAVASLATRPVPGPAVIVNDVVAALGALARAVLGRCGATVVGVTGSSGKTTTKDLLADVLATSGSTVAPRGSFNNEIGLPLTVCQVTAETRWLVLEYSARGRGHIASLCRIAPPRLAGVLNVGRAHVGEFGSLEATAAAKGELVAALPPDGTAVLNVDDPRVAAMAQRCRGRVLRVGTAAETDVRIEAVTLRPDGRPAFRLVTPAAVAEVDLGLAGAHNVANAAVAAGIGLAAGLDLSTVAAALSAARARSPHRMAVHRRDDGVTVIDDAYNANPESMAAALAALAATPARHRFAVLGVMRELGDEAESMHREVGRIAATLGVHRLVVVGEEAAGIAAGATAVPGWPGRADVVPDTDGALSLLRRDLNPDDAVLVKASNAEALWRVAEGLLGDREPAA